MSFAYEVRVAGRFESEWDSVEEADRHAVRIRNQHVVLQGVQPDVRVFSVPRQHRCQTLEAFS